MTHGVPRPLHSVRFGEQRIPFCAYLDISHCALGAVLSLGLNGVALRERNSDETPASSTQGSQFSATRPRSTGTAPIGGAESSLWRFAHTTLSRPPAPGPSLQQNDPSGGVGSNSSDIARHLSLAGQEHKLVCALGLLTARGHFIRRNLSSSTKGPWHRDSSRHVVPVQQTTGHGCETRPNLPRGTSISALTSSSTSRAQQDMQRLWISQKRRLATFPH